MNDEWVNETCENCKFCVNGRCRKNPPLIFVTNSLPVPRPEIDYPEVVRSRQDCYGNSVGLEVQLACSQFAK